ncbi:hypothetical protein LTR04_007412 [Oleoguttula sp. CCFEE 6159]|nr:hypothetical protein LTR04_007412 [Oleoguttula sp. CCFEE 6159]
MWFVTGFCDIGRNKSNRVEKSMYEIARELDMPASFVELRHEATHDELPTLQRLQCNNEDALKWLWQYYWAKIDSPLPVLSEASICEANTIDSKALAHELQTALKDFLSQRLDLLRAGTAAAMKSKDLTSAACLECVRTCHNDRRRLEVFVSVLLGEKIIIPSGRALGDNMNGAFMVWDDLLCKLVRHQRRFLRIFVTRMVHLMIQQPRMNVKQDPFREALCLWALHIFVDESWADARKRIEDSLRTKVVSICIMNPVYWGQRLARLLIEAADETFQYDWIPLYNECLPQSASSSQQDSVAPVTRGSATQRGLKRLDEVMFTPMKRPVYVL